MQPEPANTHLVDAPVTAVTQELSQRKTSPFRCTADGFVSRRTLAIIRAL
jgi:hypothetical protein